MFSQRYSVYNIKFKQSPFVARFRKILKERRENSRNVKPSGERMRREKEIQEGRKHFGNVILMENHIEDVSMRIGRTVRPRTDRYMIDSAVTV